MIPQEPTQLVLSFCPELTQQHASLKECVAARMYQQRGGIRAVAGRLDMSPSHLSEVLGGGGDRGRKFDLDELEQYISEFQDFEPILYLCARFMGDQHAEQASATHRVGALLEQLLESLPKAVNAPKGRARK